MQLQSADGGDVPHVWCQELASARGKEISTKRREVCASSCVVSFGACAAERRGTVLWRRCAGTCGQRSGTAQRSVAYRLNRRERLVGINEICESWGMQCRVLFSYSKARGIYSRRLRVRGDRERGVQLPCEGLHTWNRGLGLLHCRQMQVEFAGNRSWKRCSWVNLGVVRFSFWGFGFLSAHGRKWCVNLVINIDLYVLSGFLSAKYVTTER